MSGIDWGSVPTWISALGTTGALSATSWVIVRDRRLERRKDPERVVCRIEEINEARMAVKVHNTSDRPVYGTSVLAWTDGEFEDEELRAEDTTRPLFRMLDVLDPDRETGVLIPFAKDGQPPQIVWVQFRDIHGTYWVHHMTDHSLCTISQRQLHRILPKR
ncbi:hypothetical protein AB0M05_43545 [Streptomyces violaceusniger]|uniref:hypothetical protein n=1 Tax=Streptomyces violaceusniger TaxID=68280 RepID=UPI0034314A36